MVNQISDYIGKIVEIVQSDGTVVVGELRFFNFQDQVIHLKDYSRDRESLNERGKFMVINKGDWKSIKVKDGGK